MWKYIYREGEAENGIEPVGPAQEGKKAHLHINLGPTRILGPDEERWRGRPPKELEEQAFLRNYQASHLYQKTRNQGTWKKRVSKEEMKYLDKVVTASTNLMGQASKWRPLAIQEEG